MTPCESCPTRLASTRWAAMRLASSGWQPAARKRAAVSSARRSCRSFMVVLGQRSGVAADELLKCVTGGGYLSLAAARRQGDLGHVDVALGIDPDAVRR